MNLKAARELQNLSQMELARKTGIPQTALSLQESGTKDLELEDMAALEAKLQADLEWPDPLPMESKVAVFQAMQTLAEKFPLLTVLEFAKRTLTDRRDKTPISKLQFYAQVTQKQEGLYPAGMVEE